MERKTKTGAGERRGRQNQYRGQAGQPHGQNGYGPDGQPYYGQNGYDANGQPYYGQTGYDANGQPYYGQAGYDANGQPYYGQNGYGPDGQPYYGQAGYDPNGQPYGAPGYGPQGGYGAGGPDGGNGRKPKKKKKHRKLIFAIEILVLVLLAGGLFAMAQFNRLGRTKLKDILVNTGISKSGYRNIALFGVDSREGRLENGTNSDTIMVASINEKTGDVKLVSVYRDTYLDNTNGEYRKATECYAGGGAERSINMLNKNLDLDIKDFVTVDFEAIIEAVDLLGGVEIDVTEEERQWLNGYLVETSQVTGREYTEVAAPGMQTLTGIQAMAYCRIRYTEGWDYKRTERQRAVLGQIFSKAQQQGVTGLIGMVNSMIDYISTSLSNAELVSLATGISRYNIVDTTGFPFEKQAANISAGDCVVPVNLAQNVRELHAWMFGDESYEPSQTVQEISNQIINSTGIQ